METISNPDLDILDIYKEYSSSDGTSGPLLKFCAAVLTPL